MTCETVHIDVRAGQREIGVAVAESRRSPAIRCVTLQAFVRELILRVIVGALIVRLMTRPTVRGCIIELAVRVTLIACHAHMRSRQREVRKIVIKGRGLPAEGGVALRAFMAVVAKFMIWICGRAIGLLMARPAVGWRPRILPISMALSATCADMGASQRKAAQIMVELRRRPRRCRMTGRAVMRELQLFMIGIRCCGVICLVTRPAVGGRAMILPGDVAFGAVRSDMRSRQRERRVVMIERRRTPRRSCVAALAGVRQLVLCVVWLFRLAVIRCMAGYALRRRAGVLPIRVTLRAARTHVSAG